MHRQSDASKSVTLAELHHFLEFRSSAKTGQLMWVDIQGVFEAHRIASLLNIHPVTIEDCIAEDTREKIEKKNNYVYVVLHDISLPYENGVNLNMIIFPDLLLTVHSKPVYSIYDVVPQLDFCEDTEIPSVEFIVYAILTSVIGYYTGRIDQIKQQVEVLDGRVMNSKRIHRQDTPDLLAKISAATKQASALYLSFGIKKELLESLLRYDSIFSHKGLQYIKGALNQILKMHLQASVLHDTLSDINNLYMAKVSVQLAVTSNEVTYVSRIFSIMVAVMLPLNLIASIMGMDCAVPATASPSHPSFSPFISIVFVMFGLVIFQIAIFRGLKWI